MHPFVINEYFQLLNKNIETLGLADKLERIFNTDRSGLFKLTLLKPKWLGTRATGGPGKENTTVVKSEVIVVEKFPPKDKNVWD